ncbi:MAG: prolyl oligopeptidase family serine peptidase [Armatimonadetes bacterium]|nr:prolyl oligopeptidase family serine peptidase [Armatimonadota bacterium]
MRQTAIILAVLVAALGYGATAADLDQALQKAAAWRSDSAAFATNYAAARLCQRKLQLLDNSGYFFGPVPAREEIIEEGLRRLASIAAGEPHRAVPGRLTELAYESENDGTAQPYYLYLPPDFDDRRRWPLIVFLHGYVPSITILDPWLPSDEVCELAGQLGYMLLVPYGRRNTDFQGVGEVDVLTTIKLVQRDYPVDERRIYISGVSMGGMGAWNLALRHPGLFAAATPMCGHTDMLTWWGWPADEVPPFKKWLIEWDNPLDLVMNGRSGAFFVQHGERDRLIPVEQSRNIVAAARELGIPMDYYEHPGQDHYIYWRTECYERAWTWQLQHVLDPSPREIDFKTYTLEYDRAFWLRVDALEKWGQPGVVQVRADADRRTVKVETQNVAAFSLDARVGPMADGAEILVNGRALEPEKMPDSLWRFVLSPLPPNDRFPPPKRKGLCGPVEEVFDGPFMVVRGTGSEEARKAADKWAREWDAFADGKPRICDDADVTTEITDSYNLVLFGAPHENSVVARIADRLPIKFIEGGYQVGEREFRGDDLGLVFCYPNPEAPRRYVAIYAGPLYGARLPINHKHDLLPDFLVFRADKFDYDNANDWICGGFFDVAWRLNPETTWSRQQ